MLHYKIKKENTKNEDAYTLACCPPPSGPGSNTGCDCCYDSWTEDLKTTSSQYKYWDTNATRLDQLCTFESAWKIKLKAWLDDLDSASDIADDVSRKIILFINQLNKICIVTTDSIRAIDILFCIVKDLYIRVDLLKDEFDNLNNCITNAGKTHPELTGGLGILACLTDYGKKLQAVLDTRDGLIQSVAVAIEIAHKLQEYLCINERHCGPDRIDYGLVNILTYWKDIFSGQHTTNHGPCKFNPIITFPIKASDYYKKIAADLEKKTNELKENQASLDQARDKRAGFKASMDGLAKALAEADPALKCK